VATRFERHWQLAFEIAQRKQPNRTSALASATTVLCDPVVDAPGLDSMM
jgi:hypothetical protein